MGDRANVLVGDWKDDEFRGVYLYTHWCGSDLPWALQRALGRYQRWNDSAYLARIIFCEMVKGDEGGETGYGISAQLGDGANRVLRVDTDKQEITRGDKVWTFEAYCNLTDLSLSEVW